MLRHNLRTDVYPDLEPSSYVNHYKRATAYLSLGRSTAALDDFERILQLNPAFTQAHFQKAKILAREGEFDKAGKELKAFGKGKSDVEASELVRPAPNSASQTDSFGLNTDSGLGTIGRVGFSCESVSRKSR